MQGGVKWKKRERGQVIVFQPSDGIGDTGSPSLALDMNGEMYCIMIDLGARRGEGLTLERDLPKQERVVHEMGLTRKGERPCPLRSRSEDSPVMSMHSISALSFPCSTMARILKNCVCAGSH